MDISWIMLGVIGGIVIAVIFGFARMFFGASSRASASGRSWVNPFYTLKSDGVYYAGRIQVRADIDSFAPLDDVHPYGMDTYNVFFKAKLLQSDNPSDFRYIGRQGKDLYSTDGHSVFHNHNDISGAIASSFEIFPHSNFSRDEESIFFSGKKVFDAHCQTFQILGGEYAKDKKGYFLRRTRIQPSQVPDSLLSDNFIGI